MDAVWLNEEWRKRKLDELDLTTMSREEGSDGLKGYIVVGRRVGRREIRRGVCGERHGWIDVEVGGVDDGWDIGLRIINWNESNGREGKRK